MLNTILQISISFIITGFILSFISLFIQVNIALAVSLMLQFIGISGVTYEGYKKNNFYVVLTGLLMMSILVFNNYIIFKYNDRISKKEVPEIYYSFSTSNILLFLVTCGLFVYKVVKNKFDMSYFSILVFLMTINLIILITESVILKNYSTDG